MRAELTVVADKDLPPNLPSSMKKHFNGSADIREALEDTEFAGQYNQYRDVFVFAMRMYQTVFLVSKPVGRTFKVHLEGTNTKRTLRTLRRAVEELVAHMESFLKANDNRVTKLNIAIWVEEEDAQVGQRLYWRDKLRKQASEDWLSKIYIPLAILLATVLADFMIKADKDWINVPQATLTAIAAMLGLVIYVITKAAFFTENYSYKDSGS